jgi:hypothetical protein
MAKAQTTKGRKPHNRGLHRVELDKLLEILSACDRGVVEFWMGLTTCRAAIEWSCDRRTGACIAH